MIGISRRQRVGGLGRGDEFDLGAIRKLCMPVPNSIGVRAPFFEYESKAPIPFGGGVEIAYGDGHVIDPDHVRRQRRNAAASFDAVADQDGDHRECQAGLPPDRHAHVRSGCLRAGQASIISRIFRLVL